MDTLENSLMCRLCGKPPGIAVNIFDKNENHVRKINAILPVLVHEMDLLPKQMCHRCSYKLEEFYDFYVNCAKTDTDLKSQLSWMNKDNLEKKIVAPMVKMNPFKIKTEPPDEDCIDPKIFDQFSENSLFYPASFVQPSYESPSPIVTCSRCRCMCNSIKVDQKPQNDQINNSSKTGIEIQSNNSRIISHSSKKIHELEELSHSTVNSIIFTRNSYDNNSKKININRALRPRKGSVDYVGPKKKGFTTNLKTKLKGKVDLFDPTLVKPILKLPQSDLTTSNPIIKLEKVDEQVKISRTHKNLEEFNKRVKEYRVKKKKEEYQKDKILNCRKNFKKEANLRRKSLQNEENIQKFFKSVHVEESLKKDASFASNKNKKLDSCSSLPGTEVKNSNENIGNIDFKIKQEKVNKIMESNDFILKEQSGEQKPLIDVNNSKSTKLVEKLPLCAVVKLEKDYSCNLDYPTIKIKRHCIVTDSTEFQEGALQGLLKDKISEDKKLVNNDVKVQKILRSTEKRPKSKSKSPEKRLKAKCKSPEKSTNKTKNLEVITSRPSEKSLGVLQPLDLKRYCEKCHTYFRNSELYKLHPCYQN